MSTPAASSTAASAPPVMASAPALAGPAHNAITDLREAAGHLGRAIELIKRHHGELDALVDQRDEINF